MGCRRACRAPPYFELEYREVGSSALAKSLPSADGARPGTHLYLSTTKVTSKSYVPLSRNYD